MEMKVWISNLAKYTEGELVGAWFSLPINFEEVKEKIGLNAESEEYAIRDYELPFKVDEHESIDYLNKMAEKVMKLEGQPIYKEIQSLADWVYNGNVNEFLENVDDFRYYECENVGKLAEYLLNESGGLSWIPTDLRGYFDYNSYGRDIVKDDRFLQTSEGFFEYSR